MDTRGKLAGKLALVTGSGTGIGQEIALEFARQGAHVALHFAHSAQGAEEAVRQIVAQSGTARAFEADLSMSTLQPDWSTTRSGFSAGSTSWSTTPVSPTTSPSTR